MYFRFMCNMCLCENVLQELTKMAAIKKLIEQHVFGGGGFGVPHQKCAEQLRASANWLPTCQRGAAGLSFAVGLLWWLVKFTLAMPVPYAATCPVDQQLCSGFAGWRGGGWGRMADGVDRSRAGCCRSPQHSQRYNDEQAGQGIPRVCTARVYSIRTVTDRGIFQWEQGK